MFREAAGLTVPGQGRVANTDEASHPELGDNLAPKKEKTMRAIYTADVPATGTVRLEKPGATVIRLTGGQDMTQEELNFYGIAIADALARLTPDQAWPTRCPSPRWECAPYRTDTPPDVGEYVGLVSNKAGGIVAYVDPRLADDLVNRLNALQEADEGDEPLWHWMDCWPEDHQDAFAHALRTGAGIIIDPKGICRLITMGNAAATYAILAVLNQGPPPVKE